MLTGAGNVLGTMSRNHCMDEGGRPHFVNAYCHRAMPRCITIKRMYSVKVSQTKLYADDRSWKYTRVAAKSVGAAVDQSISYSRASPGVTFAENEDDSPVRCAVEGEPDVVVAVRCTISEHGLG